jgi:hypothetical protein
MVTITKVLKNLLLKSNFCIDEKLTFSFEIKKKKKKICCYFKAFNFPVTKYY